MALIKRTKTISETVKRAEENTFFFQWKIVCKTRPHFTRLHYKCINLSKGNLGDIFNYIFIGNVLFTQAKQKKTSLFLLIRFYLRFSKISRVWLKLKQTINNENVINNFRFIFKSYKLHIKFSKLIKKSLTIVFQYYFLSSILCKLKVKTFFEKCILQHKQ